MNTVKPSNEVIAKGMLMAARFFLDNPRWKQDRHHVDEWDFIDGWDLNLYCEEGYFSVCAYPVREVDGYDQAVTEEMYTVITRGE